jgi:hypothetical protein
MLEQLNIQLINRWQGISVDGGKSIPKTRQFTPPSLVTFIRRGEGR